MASNSDRRSGSSGRSRPRTGETRKPAEPKQKRTQKPKQKPKQKRTQKPTQQKRGGRPARARGGSRGPKELAGSGAPAAQEKRAERENRLAQRRRSAQRRSIVWLAAAALVVFGCVMLYNSGLFPIKAVEVTGTERLTEDEVRALAAVPDEATLLRFPGEEIRERVEADPWVATASVSRDFPDTMVIRIEEREPAALVDLGDEYLVVDADGYVIERESLDSTTTLLVIRDLEGIEPAAGRRSDSEGLHNALKILEQISTELRGQVSAISVPTIDETALLTNDGVEIFVGLAEDIEKKDTVAREILAEHEGTVVFVDVRTVDFPIWRGLEP